MSDDFTILIDDLRRQRTRVEQNFDDTSASHHRTTDIVRKLEELRKRAEASCGEVPGTPRPQLGGAD